MLKKTKGRSDRQKERKRRLNFCVFLFGLDVSERYVSERGRERERETERKRKINSFTMNV